MKKTLDLLRWATLAASIWIIVIISVEAFTPHIHFLDAGSLYDRSQLPVCLVFLLYFFASLYYAPGRTLYFRHNMFILVVSLPYTVIFNWLSWHPTGAVQYFFHFIPTFRAVLAMTIVTKFFYTSRIAGLFISYAIILLMTVYFSSIIFYLHESGVNPAVTGYWSALSWTLLQATTLGADYYAATVIGKVIAVVVSVMGMLMLPLFTVLITSAIKRVVPAHATDAAAPASKSGSR